jgi:hypothetical protein
VGKSQVELGGERVGKEGGLATQVPAATGCHHSKSGTGWNMGTSFACVRSQLYIPLRPAPIQRTAGCGTAFPGGTCPLATLSDWIGI